VIRAIDQQSSVIPTGELVQLRPEDVRPNPSNPRMLFDPEPLKDLKQNIRVHGVLVPITVYRLPGSEKYGILDGARRHRCCVELEEEGLELTIPANIVQPPDKIASLLYMFSIHNFREQWELMPTALSLKIVMAELGETDSKRLSNLTGLSEPQVERCKKLLEVDERFQMLSLDPDPKTRIPSNFWIEAVPVVDISAEVLPDLYRDLGRNGILDRFVAKYRAKRIRSVIHFRRIVEAFEISAHDSALEGEVASRLQEYIEDIDLETRRAFDGFIVDSRKVQSAVRACETFIGQLERANITHAIDFDRSELMEVLRRVLHFVEHLLIQMEGSDPPFQVDEAEDRGP
jgi:ParB family transcriptional regulator, chromosome partitioning protein